jgi:hypothetical protein
MAPADFDSRSHSPARWAIVGKTTSLKFEAARREVRCRHYVGSRTLLQRVSNIRSAVTRADNQVSAHAARQLVVASNE